jgi:oligoribonuclease NrnB/cAMP/cGMP phosphodiesterase (DHH superfamily)
LPERVVADYFIPGDNHWNAAGHRLVADVLFQRWAAGR